MPRRSSASISPASIPMRIASAGVPARALETALSEGRFEAEGWRVRKDGTRFWATVVIDPIHDTGRQFRRFRQGHARPDRAAGDRRGIAAQRGAVPPARGKRHRLCDLHAQIRRAWWQAGMPALQRFKAMSPEEIVGQHFSASTPMRIARSACLTRRSIEAASEGRFEAEALARAQGRHALLGIGRDRSDPRSRPAG